MAANTKADPSMKRAAIAFEKSEKTLEELGLAMGYAQAIARRAAWQFLKKTSDPRLSMLRKFAMAMGIPIEELIADAEKGKSK